MHYRSLLSSACLIGAGLVLCGPAHAADDAAAICNAAISAYGAAAATGDPAKMAAVYAPDGEVVSPYGFVAGHDALVKMYASFMKPGDKQVDTLASSHMIGDVAFCTGGSRSPPRWRKRSPLSLGHGRHDLPIQKPMQEKERVKAPFGRTGTPPQVFSTYVGSGRSPPPREKRAMNVSTFLTSCGAVLIVSGSVNRATAQLKINQTNLVSDILGLAKLTDPDLTNAWGVSFGPTSPFWISDNRHGACDPVFGSRLGSSQRLQAWP